jgi:putative ABC transport system ATP-binding protein
LRDVVKPTRAAAPSLRLKASTLIVEAGAFVSIIGKSGSGKTLINVITGIDRPTFGQVIIDHIRCMRSAKEQIAVWRGRSVGVIFQFFQLLPP